MTALENPTFTVSIPVQIRPAVHQDLPKLEWYGQYAHYRNMFRRAYREQQTGKRLILVADSNNFPIGHIFMLFLNAEKQIDKRVYLYSLRVMEMFRGCGIGTQLIHEAESLIANRHYHWSTIAAAKTNVGAKRLYERLGYEVFADDPGNWSYFDHQGRLIEVQEPCWLLQKQIEVR